MADRPGDDRRFRAALFDLDDTLVDRRASFRRFVDRFYETHPCVRASHSHEETARLFLDLDGWGHAPKDVLFGKALQIWPEIDQSVDELVEFFWDELVAGMRPIEGVPDFLRELSRAGVPWGILTNGDHRQYEKIAAAGMEGIAPFVIASRLFGSGADKPDPGIFREGLRRVRAGARETLFVGDHPFIDVQGARAVGMASAWLAHGRDWPEELDPPAYRIGHVSELRLLLLD